MIFASSVCVRQSHDLLLATAAQECQLAVYTHG